LTAPLSVVEELLRVAIDDAGERVAAQSTSLLRGGGSPSDLRAELTRLSALVDLLEAAG
jgi:hypothetical protein